LVVINQAANSCFSLGLTDTETADLVEDRISL